MLRRATADDADEIADVLTAARAAQAWFPPLHSAEETRGFVRERLLPGHDTWVVERDGRVVAFAAIADDHLGHLFVHPGVQGRGIGTALLEHTQQLLPEGFSLWTHQASEARVLRDARARRGRVHRRRHDDGEDPGRQIRVATTCSWSPRIERAMTSRWISLVPS